MSVQQENSLLMSPEAEAIVLGRAIADIRERKDCCELLSADQFIDLKHREIFKALADFNNQNQDLDVSLLAEYFKKRGSLEKVGGVSYLVGICNIAGTSADVEHYISLVKECHARRLAINSLREYTTELVKNTKAPEQILSDLIEKLNSVSKSITKCVAITLLSISRGSDKFKLPYLDKIKERMSYYQTHKKPFVDGVSSGYLDIDRLLGGFCNSNLIVLAARPGMGKTALAMNFAKKIAERGELVAFITLEMTEEQLYERLLAMESGISSEKFREGSLLESEWNKLQTSEKNISELPIRILAGEHYITDLLNKIRRLKEESQLKFLIIDYLQLIQGKGETRILEISNITRQLKNLSIELNIPILCLSQLSRKVEDRTNRVPQLSDLRESGSIEQDADSVMLLVCPDYYDSNERPNEADVLIAKNRHGETGKVTLHYNKKIVMFNNVAKKEMLNERRF